MSQNDDYKDPYEDMRRAIENFKSAVWNEVEPFFMLTPPVLCRNMLANLTDDVFGRHKDYCGFRSIHTTRPLSLRKYSRPFARLGGVQQISSSTLARAIGLNVIGVASAITSSPSSDRIISLPSA